MLSMKDNRFLHLALVLELHAWYHEANLCHFHSCNAEYDAHLQY